MAPAVLPLWPDGAQVPGRRPTLTLYPAPGAAGAATVLVLPGGGYERLGDHEGAPVALRLNEHGLHAAVLHYRLGPAHRHPAMLDDARRGVRLLRARAADRGLEPAEVAVLGFSAGGHLASTLAVHPDLRPSPEDDLRHRHSARPDALVLCYPVIDLDGPWTHAGSRRALLGDDADEASAALLSTQRHVSPATPPTFLWHSADDDEVPVGNSLEFAGACRRHGVPIELHVYESAPHGLGLADDRPDVRTWMDHCVAFLRRHLSG